MDLRTEVIGDLAVASVTYVLPLKCSEPALELDAYLAWLAPLVEVIVVDGSRPGVFEANRQRWRDLDVVHVPVDPDLVTEMGKVGGVLTGVRRASRDVVVIADDDVRWSAPQLQEAAARLAGAAVLRPQNYFTPTRWHTRWDTGRTLIARATGGDWPGTMVVDRHALVRAGGYDGSVLFENLELVRTLQAAGGREVVALDLLVARLPPSTEHFWRQRVRQAYDEWARPGRMLVELAVAPLMLLGRTKATVAVMVAAVALAEAGRRRAGGAEVFGASAPLWAPCWVAERALTSWLAVGARVLGGARYGSGRLRCAGNRRSVLRRRLADAGPRSAQVLQLRSHAEASLEADTEGKLRALSDHPDLDLHLRIQEHRVEGFIWSEGRRFRLLGVRDEEDPVDQGEARSPDETARSR